MPLREYAAFFAPEDLKNLTDAFDTTWQELSATHPELNTEEKVALMKKKLATAFSRQPRQAEYGTLRH